jgi:hypothetical protein
VSEVSFQLPVDGYETLVRILIGYSQTRAGDSPVFLTDLVASTAISKSQISRNNGFLISVGVLEREGRGFKLTADGKQLTRVLQYVRDDTEDPEIQSAWRVIVQNSDFLQRVTSAVTVRGSMDCEAFARHIALTSGAPNKPRFWTGARTVITILKAANMLVENEEGVLTPAEIELDRTDPEAIARESGILAESPLPDHAQSLVSMSRIPLIAAVQITSSTTDEELAELARKARLFARLVAIPGADETDA